MPFEFTSFPDLFIFEPIIHADQRGHFFETYNESTFNNQGLNYKFIQDNQARSCYGVIRGLHYQNEPFAQAKLIRVLEGEILDVALDLRQDSPTFSKSFSVILSSSNKKQLLIPRGFAHGYAVISPNAEVFYKCDNLYSKAHEAGIAYNDPLLEIDWKIIPSAALVSEKDLLLPSFGKATYSFRYANH
jgi:dTDP-4-dehydrorhamnose 3,5-epimerase